MFPGWLTAATGKSSPAATSPSLIGSENHGLLQVNGQLALDGDTFTNAGYPVADGLDLRLSGNLYNQTGGELLRWSFRVPVWITGALSG
ncbi:hypothetical protein CWS02_19370 [Enterobacter sp. EA-1]|nr:hypothetical protein CWS02_19370 [Enterobacter sp. EA-1]